LSSKVNRAFLWLVIDTGVKKKTLVVQKANFESFCYGNTEIVENQKTMPCCTQGEKLVQLRANDK